MKTIEYFYIEFVTSSLKGKFHSSFVCTLTAGVKLQAIIPDILLDSIERLRNSFPAPPCNVFLIFKLATRNSELLCAVRQQMIDDSRHRRCGSNHCLLLTKGYKHVLKVCITPTVWEHQIWVNLDVLQTICRLKPFKVINSQQLDIVQMFMVAKNPSHWNFGIFWWIAIKLRKNLSMSTQTTSEISYKGSGLLQSHDFPHFDWKSLNNWLVCHNFWLIQCI